MNEVLNCILTRRSIRSFDSSKKVSQQQLETILKAGMYAPSAMNKQSWEFVVINEKDVCEKLTMIHPHATYIKDSQCAILVCGDVEKSFADYWVQDCSACSENMLLAIHSLGLGAVWCGVYPNDKIYPEIAKMFNLPKNIVPMSLIVLGYPTKQPSQPTDRFDSGKIHYNKW